MRVIKQHWSFEPFTRTGEEVLKLVESAGRTCYKSEGKIEEDSATAFVAGLLKRGHTSVLDHVTVSVRIVTDRGVTHELVRHRLAAYSQESTRYCNYAQEKFGSEITLVLPVWFYDCLAENPAKNDRWFQYGSWKNACEYAERVYFELLKIGQTPQEARSVLPNSLKTEIVTTFDLTEWRHFFKLRTARAAHPQMRELAQSMLVEFRKRFPVVFDGVGELV